MLEKEFDLQAYVQLAWEAGRAVSPIWSGERLFHFLCLGHLQVAEALGFELMRSTPKLMTVREGQVSNAEALAARRQTWCDDGHVAAAECRALRGMLEARTDEGRLWGESFKDVPAYWCGGGCFGPLTVASDILGVDQLLRLVAKDPGLVDNVVEFAADYLVELAKREATCRPDFFWVAEPVFSLLPPHLAWRFSGRQMQRIFAASGAPGFLHVCGNTNRHNSVMVSTGAQLLSIDYLSDLGTCLDNVPGNVVVMGNISPATLRFDTTRQVEVEVRAALDAVRGRGNFVLSTGCSIMEGTPDENMRVLIAAVQTIMRG